MKIKITISIIAIVILGVFIIANGNRRESGQNAYNFLVPSSKTIPEGFVGSLLYLDDPNEGYSGQYDNTNDINSNGNPAQIFISAQVDNDGSGYESTFEYYNDLSTKKNREIKEFSYGGLRGFVFDSTTYPRNYDLVVKDGPRLYKISTRDGTKNKFSVDDLVTMFKTFEEKSTTNSVTEDYVVNSSPQATVTKPISDTSQKNGDGSLNEPTSSGAVKGKSSTSSSTEDYVVNSSPQTTVTKSIPDTSQKNGDGSLNELTSSGAVIGPEVVTGYIWYSNEGSPSISSVNLPAWGIIQDKDFIQREYTIDIWDGKDFIFYAKASPFKEVFFPSGGVYKFRVQGINPDYAICPGDRSVYTWGMKFATSGTFSGGRIPITVDVSSQGKSCKVAR